MTITNEEAIEKFKWHVASGEMHFVLVAAHKRVLHLAECWVKLAAGYDKRTPDSYAIRLKNDMAAIESPPPKDPLDELAEWVEKRKHTIACDVASKLNRGWLYVGDLEAKIAELRGKK